MIFVWQVLAAHPELRGTGVAWLLVRRMEEIARERGATKIVCQMAAFATEEGTERDTAIENFTTSMGYEILDKSAPILVGIGITRPLTEDLLGLNVFQGISIIKDLTTTSMDMPPPFLPSNFTEEIATFLRPDEINNPDIESWTIRWKENVTNRMVKIWYLVLKGVS